MKYFVIFAVSLMALAPAFADELEDTKAQYQQIVNSFTDNLNTQRLLVEGFKASNATFQALIKEQGKLQKQAQKLAGVIKKLEAPVSAEPPKGTEETEGVE